MGKWKKSSCKEGPTLRDCIVIKKNENAVLHELVNDLFSIAVDATYLDSYQGGILTSWPEK